MFSSQIGNGFNFSPLAEVRKHFRAAFMPHALVATKAVSSSSQIHQAVESVFPYQKIVFICPAKPSENLLSGDQRLAVDLADKLALGFNIPSEIVTPSDLGLDKSEINALSQDCLYVGVNYALPENYGSAHQFISVAINSDQCWFSCFRKSDVYFEPFYRRFSDTQNSIVHPITTLPSRITPEAMSAETAEGKFDTKGRPVIAIMIRDMAPERIVELANIARILSQRHNACFLVGTGPRTNLGTEALLEKEFENIPDSYVHCWNKSRGQPNPYRWMLGAATHFVTSGTLSTTCDMLATGRPVYYNGAELRSPDDVLKDKLIREGSVGELSVDMLDKPPPNEEARRFYMNEWRELAAHFADDVAKILQRRKTASFEQKILEESFASCAAQFVFFSNRHTPLKPDQTTTGLLPLPTAKETAPYAVVGSAQSLPSKPNAEKRDYGSMLGNSWQKQVEKIRITAMRTHFPSQSTPQIHG
jgi:hypothetical protein